MRFELSDDQALLRQSTRDFLAREAPFEKSRRVMEQDPRGWDPALWRQLADMGYLGLVLPPAAGGQGLGAIELAIVLEEMGRAGVPGPYLDVVLAATLLAATGGDAGLLAEVVQGRKLVTIARDDAALLPGPPARCAGERLVGRFDLVPFAAAADALIVAAGGALHLVRGPFDATPLETFDPAERLAAVELDHRATPLGGADALAANDRLASVGAGAMLFGIMSRLLDTTLAYVQTREAFRRPIGSFQALQHRLADMLLRAESTRSAVYRAAWCLDAGDADAPIACAAAKAYAGDAARMVASEAIQMHGGIGYTWELDVHFYFKRAKTLEQRYGSTPAQLDRALAAAGL